MDKAFSTSLLLNSMLLLTLGCESTVIQQSMTGPNSKMALANPETANVTWEDLSHTVVVPAEIEGYEMVVLKSRLEAHVGEVIKDIGDEVSQGDLLARLDVPEMVAEEDRLRQMVSKAEADLATRRAQRRQAEAQLAQQEALLRQREIEYRRIKGLVDGGALTPEQLDESQFAVDAVHAALERVQADISAAGALVRAAEADVDVAKAELRKALALATYLEIRAPFDGLITERHIDVGELVRPGSERGSELLKIENISKLRVVFYLPMEDAATLEKNAPVTLHDVHSAPGRTFSGTVTRFAKSFNRNSRMMRVEVHLDNPLDATTNKRLLNSGDYGKVTLTLATHKNVATVPSSAIVDDQAGGQYVVEVDDQGVCRRRPVVVQLARQGKSGVTQPDGMPLAARRVITSGAKDFNDGQQVMGETTTVP